MEINKKEIDTTKSRLDMLLSLELTEQETLQANCNHLTDDGTSDTFRIDGESVICTKCGTKFVPLSEEKKFAIQDVEAVINILETAKIFADGCGKKTDYFDIIPLLKRLPEIYESLEKEFDVQFSKELKQKQQNLFAALSPELIGTQNYNRLMENMLFGFNRR